MIHRIPYSPLLLCTLLIWLATAPQTVPAAPHAEPTPEAPAPLDSAPFGLNTHLASRYPELNSMDVPAELVKQTGIGWAREDIHWWRIQPQPETWDWSYTDAAMRALITRDINVVGVLGHPPGWATPYAGDVPANISFYAPDPDRFATFAAVVAQRYSRYIHTWEIWNEPDNPLFWKPAPDPASYAALLMRTAAAIRSVNPQARILIGGINPFDTHFLREVAAAGAWNSFDIIAIHPYTSPTAPEAGNIAAAADGVRALAAQLGPKPIWATEIGWASGADPLDPLGRTDEEAQASYLVRAALLLWRAGVERIFWYTLKDDPGSPYGLVAVGTSYADYSQLKPAFYALRTLNQQLAGAEFVGMRDLFQRTSVLDFETFGGWRRGDQPYGTLRPTRDLAHGGQSAAQLSYDFLSSGNDYVVFQRNRPASIPGAPYGLGIWVYGDGSGCTLKLWLRDAEGEVLQYSLGTIGPHGWRLLQAPIGGAVAPWNRISEGGNGRLDFPARLDAIVLDDAPDSFRGSGAIYLDDLVAISGPEAYDLQLRRSDTALDVLWAPEGVRASISSAAASGRLTERDGSQSTYQITDSKIVLNLGTAPIYIEHTR